MNDEIPQGPSLYDVICNTFASQECGIVVVSMVLALILAYFLGWFE